MISPWIAFYKHLFKWRYVWCKLWESIRVIEQIYCDGKILKLTTKKHLFRINMVFYKLLLIGGLNDIWEQESSGILSLEALQYKIHLTHTRWFKWNIESNWIFVQKLLIDWNKIIHDLNSSGLDPAVKIWDFGKCVHIIWIAAAKVDEN